MGQPNPTQTVTNPRIAKLIELEVSGRIKPEHQQELDTYRAQGLAPKKSSGNSLTEYQGKSTGFYERALGLTGTLRAPGKVANPLASAAMSHARFCLRTLSTLSRRPHGKKRNRPSVISFSPRSGTESGAAIAASELEKQEKTFFPRPATTMKPSPKRRKPVNASLRA